MKDGGFLEFVLDQLEDSGKVRAKPMFGGYGLYLNAAFFGIVYQETLYLKTDATSRTAYIERKMKPFRPSPKQTLKNYFEVPIEVLEDRDELAAWAHAAANSIGKTAPKKG
jgi:DNA transformation protein